MIHTVVAYVLLAASIALAADTEKALQASFRQTCSTQKFMGAVANRNS